jgi:hypothetical protein
MREKLPMIAFVGFALFMGYARYRQVADRAAPAMAQLDRARAFEEALKARKKESAEIERLTVEVIRHALAGQWTNVESSHQTIRFTDEREFVCRGPALFESGVSRGKYRVIDGSTIEFSAEERGLNKWGLELDGGSLELRSPTGRLTRFRRSR